VGNPDPYAYKTTDYGDSWASLTGGIPRSVFSYVHVIREDPVRPGLLYLGTENALYVSFDDGGAWVPLQSNLPHAPVHWLTVQEHFNDLVVATYGRGFWILDDITPLQQLWDEVTDASLHLFTPRPAYRFRRKEASVSQPEDPGAGENPRIGATLHYLVGEGGEGAVKLEILDDAGEVVATPRAPSSEPGLHRAFWDLSYEASETPRMRTPVLEHSHVEIGDDGWRPAGETGRVSPMAPPGRYTVRLTRGDRELTRTLEVVKDPNSAGSVADIRDQFQVILHLRDEANAVVELINEAEMIRAQLTELDERLGDEGKEEVRAVADSVDEALIELEMQLTDLRLSGGTAGQDRLRWPRQLYAKITSLAGYIGSSDFPPTDQHLEVRQRLQELLAQHQARMEEIRSGELASLNRMLVEMGFPHISGMELGPG